MALTQRSSWMSDDLDAFRDLAHTFCQKELAPNHERWEQAKQVDRELWLKAGEVGLLCLSIPEEYGGGGGTFAHEAVLLEEQAKAGDDAWGNAVHSGIVAHYLGSCGTEEQSTMPSRDSSSRKARSITASSSPVCDGSVPTRNWSLSASPSKSPKTVCVLPTSIASSIVVATARRRG